MHLYLYGIPAKLINHYSADANNPYPYRRFYTKLRCAKGSQEVHRIRREAEAARRAQELLDSSLSLLENGKLEFKKEVKVVRFG